MSAFKEVRFDIAPDRSLTVAATPQEGETQRLSIPVAEITGFVAHMLATAADAGRKDPDAAGADLPPESQGIITYPLRVGLSDSMDHPTLVINFGDASVNIGIDKATLRHLLQRLDTLYPG